MRFVLNAILIVLSALVTGFVLSVLWGWFIVPVFPGSPTLGFGQSLGISLMISAFTLHLGKVGSARDTSLATTLLGGIVVRIFLLIIGAVYHLLFF